MGTLVLRQAILHLGIHCPCEFFFSNSDVPMEGIQHSVKISADSSAKEDPGDEVQKKAHTCLIVNFINVFGRVRINSHSSCAVSD